MCNGDAAASELPLASSCSLAQAVSKEVIVSAGRDYDGPFAAEEALQLEEGRSGRGGQAGLHVNTHTSEMYSFESVSLVTRPCQLRIR